MKEAGEQEWEGCQFVMMVISKYKLKEEGTISEEYVLAQPYRMEAADHKNVSEDRSGLVGSIGIDRMKRREGV